MRRSASGRERLPAGAGSWEAAIAPGPDVSCNPRPVSPPRAGTITAAPLVISQTNGTASSDVAANPRVMERQPSSGIAPAASGRKTATPIPGPAYATPSASPATPA